MDDQDDREPREVSPIAAPAVPAIESMPAPPTPVVPGPLEPAEVGAPTQPGRRFPHVVRFVFALIGWVGVSIAMILVVTDALTRDLYGSEAARDEALATATSIAVLTSTAWVLITMGLIARLVGYRIRDAFFMLVPLYAYAFAVKMLWRWTALPRRPWDEPGIPGPVDTEVPSPPRRALRPADPFIAIMCVLSLVGLVWFSDQVDDTTVAATPDEWETVQARGMTIDVPKGYIITTDPAEASQLLSESGDPAAEDLGEMLTQFPNLFVMMAVEPSFDAGTSIAVFRYPSGGEPLEVSARAFRRGAEQSGFELVSEETTTVGTGAYPAVRFDWVGGPPPPDPSIDYIIDDGPQVWTVGFVMPDGADAEMTPIVDAVIDSVTLP